VNVTMITQSVTRRSTAQSKAQQGGKPSNPAASIPYITNQRGEGYLNKEINIEREIYWVTRVCG
jgi:hypothetical protein